MPINPIDIALTAPRSQEASYTHTNQNKQVEHAQVQTGRQFAEHIEHDNRQTVETEKKQWPDYTKRESSGGQTSSREKKDQKKKKDEKIQTIKSENILDIKI